MNWLDWAIIALLCWGFVNGYGQGKKAFWAAVLLLPVGTLLSLGFRPLMTAFMEQAWAVSYRVEKVVAPMLYYPVGARSGDPAAVLSYMGLPEVVVEPVVTAGGITPAAMISRAFVSSLTFVLGTMLFYAVLKTIFSFLSPEAGPVNRSAADAGLGLLGGGLLGLAVTALPVVLLLPLVPLWPVLGQSLLLQRLLNYLALLMF